MRDPRCSVRLTGLAAWLIVTAAFASAADPTAPAPAAPPADASVQLPPWMSVDVVKAAVAIGMTDTQKAPFNAAVGTYVTDYFAMIQKELKRNAPDLDMRFKSRDKALVHKLDDAARKILTEAQWPAYQQYKSVLRADMQAVTPNSARVPSGPRSGPSSGVPGGSITTQD